MKIHQIEITDDMPPRLAEMQEKQAELYIKKCNLLNSLNRVPENDKRGIGAVMKMWRPVKDELDQIAADVETYFRTGNLPEAPQKRAYTLDSLKLEIKKLQSNKSTYKGRMSKAKTQAKKDSFQEQIIQLDTQIAQLQKHKRELEASLVGK